MQSAVPAKPYKPFGVWVYVALAGSILMVAYGVRLTVGLFVHPISLDKGLTIGQISFALAIGQISWGVFQPVFGAWADKGHGFAALFTGAMCIVAGQLLTMVSSNVWLFTLAQGIFAPAGIAAGSFAILIGVVGSRIPPDKRSVASGIINAGGSVGQFVFAPAVQFIMHLRGYYASLLFLAGMAIVALVPARLMCRGGKAAGGGRAEPLEESDTELTRPGLRDQLRVAVRNPSFILLNAGFFTCGFHVAFLVTHLPGEVSACGHSAAVAAASISMIGLCNIAGSIGVGILGKYYRMKYLLAIVYAARAVMIVLFVMSSKSELSFYIFSAATGFTWLATVPPTAGITGKLFGQRYLATLFGLTFLTHQVGGFFGAWLGGVAMEQSGSLLWVWYVDIALAMMAAAVNLPIKEKPVLRLRPAV